MEFKPESDEHEQLHSGLLSSNTNLSGSRLMSSTNSNSPYSHRLDSKSTDKNDIYNPHWRRPEDTIVGYAGHVPESRIVKHVLESPLKKQMISGYTGYVPQSKNICGSPIIKVESMRKSASETSLPSLSGKSSHSSRGSPNSTLIFNRSNSQYNESVSQSTFRNYAKHMDTEERYAVAVEQLARERNQTQESLLYMLQAKLSERIMSYAQQKIRTRILFEGFDKDNDGYLNENEFRDCLENQNVQFDDIQILALFAYFDRHNTG